MFQDHYLDVEYDLSKVFFIATANVLHTIPPALQDRLEVLRLSGYTEREKLEIAKRHLVPKQAEANGLGAEQFAFTDEGILEIIRHYTREAGVRNLERELGSCCRKIARKFVAESVAADYKDEIGVDRVQEMLGPVKFRQQGIAAESEIGLATGLAWTEVGGEVLQIEGQATVGHGIVVGGIGMVGARRGLPLAHLVAPQRGRPGVKGVREARGDGVADAVAVNVIEHGTRDCPAREGGDRDVVQARKGVELGVEEHQRRGGSGSSECLGKLLPINRTGGEIAVGESGCSTAVDAERHRCRRGIEIVASGAANEE